MKPNLTFIIDRMWAEIGGTERQLGRMIRALAPHFQIELICFRESDWLREKASSLLPCTIRVFDIGNVRRASTYLNLIRLVRHLRATDPTVVHTFFPIANIVGVLAAWLAGVNGIVSSRRDYGEWMSPRYLAATRFANRFVTHIITNSEQVKRLTVEVEGVPERRVSVIHNGIDMAAMRRDSPNLALKTTLGVAPTNKVVMLIANYRPMKRQETLVRAAQLITRERDDIDFLLVGRDAVPGSPRQAVEALTQSLGVGNRVHFSEADGNVKDFLSIADIGVNTSQGEGLSNAIMEYMAYGIPCVVSASGGNTDLIDDGVTGSTFALGDHEALARRIVELVDDPKLAQRYADSAAEKMRSQMSVEAMVDRFTRFYRDFGRTPVEAQQRLA